MLTFLGTKFGCKTKAKCTANYRRWWRFEVRASHSGHTPLETTCN